MITAPAMLFSESTGTQNSFTSEKYDISSIDTCHRKYSTIVEYSNDSSLYTMTYADVNNDNKSDIIVADIIPSKVDILLNNGNGIFTIQTLVYPEYFVPISF